MEEKPVQGESSYPCSSRSCDPGCVYDKELLSLCLNCIEDIQAVVNERKEEQRGELSSTQIGLGKGKNKDRTSRDATKERQAKIFIYYVAIVIRAMHGLKKLCGVWCTTKDISEDP